MRLILAFLSAATLPALLMTLLYLHGEFRSFEIDDPYAWARTGRFAMTSFIVSGAFVLMLGMPAYLILRKLRLVRCWPTLIAGFCLAAIPIAISTWPLRHSGLTNASANGVQTMIDGVPTLAGWLQFMVGVSFLGACGFVGALAFWMVAPSKVKQANAQEARAVPEKSRVSAAQGQWFVFEDEWHQIALWASSFTGREEVFVDGKKISESRSVRFATTHDFSLDGERYRLELTTVSVLKGIYRCTLFRNDSLIGCFETEYLFANIGIRVIATWISILWLATAYFSDLISAFFALAALGFIVLLRCAWPAKEARYVVRERET